MNEAISVATAAQQQLSDQQRILPFIAPFCPSGNTAPNIRLFVPKTRVLKLT
jgi:hypothetical protein